MAAETERAIRAFEAAGPSQRRFFAAHPLHARGNRYFSGFRRRNRVKFRPAMKAVPG